jgi:hypothetical protein
MDKLDTLFWLLCANYMLLIAVISAVGYRVDKLETRIRELEKKSNEKDM